jgi:hypothetical protein
MNRSKLYWATGAACLVVLGLLSAQSAPPKTEGVKDKAEEQLFDPDPEHPWNRLHQVFYVRSVSRGGFYVHGGLDAPPLGSHGSYALEGAAYEKAIHTLDAFLNNKDDERVRDPLPRALLQRDLWHVFDTLAEPGLYLYPEHPRDCHDDPKQRQRRALLKRLGQVIHRLEQPTKQLEALPDNYALAVKSKAFATAFDPEHPRHPYLPTDLRLDGRGDWVAISRWHPNGSTLAALHHQMVTQHRAVFLAFLRLPGGRKAAEAYLKSLPPADERNPETFPALPDGSQAALVRRMLVIDDRGMIQATPLTESVQLRVFPKGKEQHFVELTLDRAALLSRRSGLRPVGPTEVAYFGFGVNEARELFDKELKPKPEVILSNCVRCHASSSSMLFSIHTFGFQDHTWYAGAAQTDFAAQVRHTMYRKMQSYSWGLLQGLRETTP